MLKQVSKRELLRHPQLLNLAHGQTLVVTHRGKPDVVISPAVKRRGKPVAEYLREAEDIFGKKARPTYNGPEFLRSIR